MTESTDQTKLTSPVPAAPAPAWRNVAVPTDGMPGFAKSIYSTAPGKLLYYVTSDAALFLRVSVIVAAFLGLLYTLFHVWSLRVAGPSVVWAAFFIDLFITLVATGVLYAMRTIVETLEKR
jgi:hypothetical protein